MRTKAVSRHQMKSRLKWWSCSDWLSECNYSWCTAMTSERGTQHHCGAAAGGVLIVYGCASLTIIWQAGTACMTLIQQQ